MEIRIELSPEARETLRDIQTLPARALDAMTRAMDTTNNQTVSDIQRNYLSFPKDQPPVAIGCRADTGALRRSIRASAAHSEGAAIVSAIGSNVQYAAAQEFGYDGEQTVNPFVRHVKSRDTYGRVAIGERTRRIRTSEGIGFVQGFTREMHLPGRGFVQRGIADNAAAYSQAMGRAIIDSFNSQ